MQLAQLNIARALSPLDSPLLKEFVDNLAGINGLAERSPGFIWRLQDESGDATSIKLFDDPNLIVNLSVWESVDTLKDFIIRTRHVEFLQRRYEWFEKMAKASHVMWWVQPSHVPTVQEALERLEYLHDIGDSSFAFGFRATQYHSGID